MQAEEMALTRASKLGIAVHPGLTSRASHRFLKTRHLGQGVLNFHGHTFSLTRASYLYCLY